MSTLALRPRSATEIVDASFQLLRQRYFQLVALAVVALLPYMVMQFVAATTGTGAAMATAVVVVQLLCTVAAEGTMVVGVSDSYLEGELNIGTALARTLVRLPAIFGAAVVRAVLILLAVIPVGIVAGVVMPSVMARYVANSAALLLALVVIALLAVPAVYVGIRTFATTAALILERMSVGRAITRSWQLARGGVGRIFFALFLAWLLYFVLFIVFTTIVSMLVGRNTDLVSILTAVILAFAYPLIGVVTTLLYYDLRVRQEGFDLELLARELEPHPTPLQRQ